MTNEAGPFEHWYSRSWYAEVDSFAPVEELRPLFAAWCRQLWFDLVLPVLGSFGELARDPADQFTTSPPRTVVPALVTEGFGDGPIRQPRYGERAVDRVLGKLGTDLRHVQIAAGSVDRRGVVTGHFSSVAADFAERYDSYAHRLRVSVSGAFVRDSDVAAMEAGLLRVLTELGVAARAATGYATVDFVYGSSPYEASVGTNHYFGMRDCGTRLRGYYWANLLNPEHVSRLGGVPAVRAALPGAHVEELDDRPLVLVRLPGPADGVARDDLERLRDLFAPILVTGVPGYAYDGFPLRLV